MPTRMISASRVKQYALEYAKRSERVYVRTHMTRLSSQVLVELDNKVREWIRQRVDSQPSKGKTIM